MSSSDLTEHVHVEEAHALALPHEGEVEVVKPEVLARWRAWGVPEYIINKLILQRQRIIRIRKAEEWITVPNFAYKMPRLPQIEANRWGLAKSIDFEGTIMARTRRGVDRIAKKDETFWRYYYLHPIIRIEARDYDLIEEMANMMHVAVRVSHMYDRLTKRYVIMYRAEAREARAVMICHLIHPYLKVAHKKERTQQIFQTYKQSPLVRL